jgi:hypothetical protein
MALACRGGEGVRNGRDDVDDAITRCRDMRR